jgi:hypothetical protein
MTKVWGGKESGTISKILSLPLTNNLGYFLGRGSLMVLAQANGSVTQHFPYKGRVKNGADCQLQAKGRGRVWCKGKDPWGGRSPGVNTQPVSKEHLSMEPRSWRGDCEFKTGNWSYTCFVWYKAEQGLFSYSFSHSFIHASIVYSVPATYYYRCIGMF